MKKLISILLSVITLLSVLSFGTAVYADQHPGGWAFENGNWYYYESGLPLSEGIYEIDGVGYYFNYQGVMKTGWIDDGGSYLDPETGQPVSYSAWYYASSSGALAEGWKKIKNVWYYFEPGAYYMYEDGIYEIGGKKYLFKSSGAMVTGWFSVSFKDYYNDIVHTTWYYCDSNGVLATGWKKINNVWYYFDTDGWMYADTEAQINGRLYFFTKSGAMLTNGWGKSSWSDWYYADKNGNLLTGWQKIKGTWYYFSTDEGYMYIGGHTIGNKVYLFDGNGAWIAPSGTGWKSVKFSITTPSFSYNYTEWFYFKDSKIVTGWQKIGGKWYFFDKETAEMYYGGAYKTNAQDVYFFENSGAMRTKEGWSKETYDNGEYDWYYVLPSGICLRGWQNINGKWYYFNEYWAYMCTGEQTIEGKDYVFAESGELISGEAPGAVG